MSCASVTRRAAPIWPSVSAAAITAAPGAPIRARSSTCVHDAAFRPCQVLRHVIGTDPATDALVFSEPDARYHVTVGATRSGDWIVISTEARDTNEQWIIPAARHDDPPRLIEPRRRGVEYFTEHLAGLPPRRRAWQDSRSSPTTARPSTGWSRRPPRRRAARNWRELVPGDPQTRFRRLDVVGGHLVLSCRSGGDPFLRIVRPDGSHHDQHPGTPAGHHRGRRGGCLRRGGIDRVHAVARRAEALVVGGPGHR